MRKDATEFEAKACMSKAFDANERRVTTTVYSWCDFKEGDIIYEKDTERQIAIMVGWNGSQSVWRFNNNFDTHADELFFLPVTMAYLVLPTKVSRLASQYDTPLPEHQVKNFKWDWCFWCDAIHARCPRCDVNSCSCGCGLDRKEKTSDGECPEKGWWRAQHGEEYEAEREARPHPERDRLIKFIQKLNEIPEEKLWERQMICDPFNVMEHARWHGLDVTFEWKDEKDWKITLNSLPTDEARPVYYPNHGRHQCINLSKPGKSVDAQSTQE